MKDNIRKETKNTNPNQNIPSCLTKINQVSYPIKSLTPKPNENFQTVPGSCNINITGSQPIIMYRKEHKETLDPQMRRKLMNNPKSQNNQYVSDGGLKQKLEKFSTGSSQPSRTLQKSLKTPKNSYYNCINNNNNIPNKNPNNINNNLQKQKKFTLEEQKLFSRTVRDSNKRPVFPKSDKSKECSKTKNGFGTNNNSNRGKDLNQNKSHKHLHQNKNKNIPIEDSKVQEERKLLYMNKLVEDAVVGEIRKYQKEKKLTPKELFVEKKKELLQENGTPIDLLVGEVEETSKTNQNLNEEDMKMNEDIKEEENTTSNNNNNIVLTGNYNRTNNNNYNIGYANTTKSSRPVQLKYNNYFNSYEESPYEQKIKKKFKNKPSVNPFEYLDKIKNEQKKLPVYSEYHKRSMSQEISSNQLSSQTQLNDSFRRKNPNLKIDNIEDNNLANNNQVMKNNFMGNFSKSHEKKYIPPNNKFSNNNTNKYGSETTTESVQKTSEDGIDDFPYAHKKSHRTKQELKQFVKEKRIKDKQEEERKLLEKNKRVFLLFKNLHNLNLKDLNINLNENTNTNNEKTYSDQNQNNNPSNPSSSQTQQQSLSPPAQNSNSVNSKSCQNFYRAKQTKPLSLNDKHNRSSNRANRSNSGSNSNSSNCVRKKKEINEYYIGNDAAVKNNSTLIDPNEYYLNVLESQQLLVNSGLKRIENETETSEEKNNTNNTITTENNNTNNNNTNNSNKKQIQKITDRESKRFNDSSSKKSNILNTNNYDDLKQKIDNTLKRANEVFAKDNLKNYVNNLTTSSVNDNREKTNTNEENSESPKKKNQKDERKSPSKNSSSGKKKKTQVSNNNKGKGKKNEQKMKMPSPEINIEASNTDNNNKLSKTGTNTKEGPLPSLTHTYSTNSNPNKKVEIEIEPSNVLNLVEILKFIIQRKVFIRLYEYYISRALIQRYQVACAYLVAICKQYPFRKLEELSNYKTYNFTFRQLIRPFIRKYFRAFVNSCYTKRKIEFLVILLTKIFKFKILERIYIYCQFADGNEERAFKFYIMKIMLTLIKPYMQEVFDTIKNYDKKNNKNNIKGNEVDIKNKNTEEEDDDDDNLLKEYERQLAIKAEKEKEKAKTKENDKNNNGIGGLKLDNIDKFDAYQDSENNDRLQCEGSDSDLNDDNSLRRHKKFDNSIKMNSYLYESFGEDSQSSPRIEPNTMEEQKLHQLKLMLIRNRGMEEEEEEDEEDDLIPQYINSEKKNGKNINLKKNEHPNKILSDLVDGESKSSGKKNYYEDDMDENINKNNQKFNNNIINKNLEEKEPKKNSIKEISQNKRNEDKIDYPENKRSISEIDISADNDVQSSVEWEYNLSTKGDEKKKEPENKGKNIKENFNTHKAEGNDLTIKEDINEVPEEKNDKGKNNNSENKLNKDKDKEKVSDSDNEYGGDFEDISLTEKDKENKIEAKIPDIKNIIKEDEKDTKQAGLDIKLKEENKIPKESAKTSEEEKKKEEEKKQLDKKIEKEKQKEKEEKEHQENLKKLKNLSDKQAEDLSSFLTDEVLSTILSSEIKSAKKKLVPLKKFKFDKFEKKNESNSLANSFSSVGNIRDNLSKEFGLGGGLSHLSLTDDLISLNDSIMSQYTARSVFNKTVKDKKKEGTLTLYYKMVAPKLIRIIRKEIYNKYPRIYENISSPMRNCSEKLMISLALQDADMLRDNYKSSTITEDIETILDKQNILKQFEIINKQIRSNDNVASDNFYDNMLNDCIIDTTIELINKERYYGKNGEPLKWSARTHELSFKYKKDNPKKLADYFCKNLMKSLHNKIGLITENYDYLNTDQINIERDRRLVETIKNDLDENEYQWNNLEMEETQLKVESTEMILDQLYNEVIEILEHIQFSRMRPDLYQHKSIYACEEIPKLSFQQTTTEDAALVEGEDNVMI